MVNRLVSWPLIPGLLHQGFSKLFVAALWQDSFVKIPTPSQASVICGPTAPACAGARWRSRLFCLCKHPEYSTPIQWDESNHSTAGCHINAKGLQSFLHAYSQLLYWIFHGLVNSSSLTGLNYRILFGYHCPTVMNYAAGTKPLRWDENDPIPLLP